jgi:Cof subfamily protein (haloacid dehalogenase superfamily)
MSYRLILSDLDGTLLNCRSEVTDEVRRSVAEIEASGAHFALCSGRAYRSLAFFEKQLGLDAPGHYGVCFNGGVVYKTDTHELLLENRLDRAISLSIIKDLKEFGASILVYVNDTLYAEKADSETSLYSKAALLPLIIARDFSDIKEDFSKVLIKGDYESLSRIHEIMAPRLSGKANLCFSANTLLEFSSPKSHKGFGLAFLRDYLGVSPDETLAIGDHRNDLTMLREAGLGVAVKNAAPEAKEAADAILDRTNDENAIGRVAELYIL